MCAVQWGFVLPPPRTLLMLSLMATSLWLRWRQAATSSPGTSCDQTSPILIQSIRLQAICFDSSWPSRCGESSRDTILCSTEGGGGGGRGKATFPYKSLQRIHKWHSIPSVKLLASTNIELSETLRQFPFSVSCFFNVTLPTCTVFHNIVHIVKNCIFVSIFDKGLHVCSCVY